MAPTSDERREVAERLRSLAARGQGISCDAVDKELGIWYDDSYFGCVFACESVLRLADLIDPTCHVVTSGERRGKPIGSACSVCHAPLYPSTAWAHGMRYCSQCGSRVVDDDNE